MMKKFWVRVGATLFLVAPIPSALVYSQTQLQVGYAILTSDQGSGLPVSTALFSSTRAGGVLLWEVGVGAVEPMCSGRIFVDQLETTRTAVALVNPSSQSVTVSLILRDPGGIEVDQITQVFSPGQHQALFLDELFSELEIFTGSLTFQTAQPEQKMAAITLRENKNRFGESIFATLPVVDLSSPPSSSLIFPHIGAGDGLSTQIVLINPNGQEISGRIELFDSEGLPLQMELNDVEAPEFPYALKGHGVFRAELNRSGGTDVGYAVVTTEQGATAPAGSAIFQFRANGAVSSEAGVAAVLATQQARIFVDQLGTRTGVAIASPGNPAVTVSFDLLSIDGSFIQTTTRDLLTEGHLAIFVDELFAGLEQGFTGLLEIRSPEPIVPVSLKLTEIQGGDSILTTLPVADLMRTQVTGTSIFPQVGFGESGDTTFATRLISINTDPDQAVIGSLDFFRPDGADLTVPLGEDTGSRFPFQIPGGVGRSFAREPRLVRSPRSFWIRPIRLLRRS